MKKFFSISAAVFMAVIFFALSSNFVNAAEILPKGEGIYKFAEPSGKNNLPIDIHYYRPTNWKDGNKIFVAFHGSGRKAQPFVTGLKKIAEEKNFLLICPEFSREKYPYDNGYNYGRVFIKRKMTPENEWTYNVANKIIDDLKERAGVTKSKITFFGHSAGGQFMNRYLFLANKIKADRVIAANSGTYIAPDENTKFPHGLKNVPLAKQNLKRAYKQDVIVLLGERDISRKAPKSPTIDKLGLNRLERGKNFFAMSQKKAEEIGTKFNWRLIIVPNVGHSRISMAKNALKYLK